MKVVTRRFSPVETTCRGPPTEDLWSAAELDFQRGIHVYPLHHGAQSNHEIMRRGRSNIFEQNPVTIRRRGGETAAAGLPSFSVFAVMAERPWELRLRLE